MLRMHTHPFFIHIARSIFIVIFCVVITGGCAAESQSDVPEVSSTPAPTLQTEVLLFENAGRPSQSIITEKLGVDLGGVGERALEFVDVARTLRRWENVDADGCPEDDNICRHASLDDAGYPMTDARTVFFDKRPFGAWWGLDQEDCPLCQDGHYQIDMSGTYKLGFSGQAVLHGIEREVEVAHQMYDKKTNTTTADIVVNPGQGLLYLSFVDTKRTPDSEVNTGITDVHLMRPGYDLDTDQIFTPYIVEAVKPFSILRFMNWVGGNNINPAFDPESDCTLDWDERNLPESRQNQAEGVAWEYVIELANLSHKNIWINIPIHATDDYILGLANLLNTTLHSDAVIYIESSNEVWNPIFSQEAFNRLAAQHEVETGESNLETGRLDLPGMLAQRRHVRRLVEISEIFREVFGDEAINDKIRVMHSWWSIQPAAYQSQLQWVKDTYGPPNRYFYAVAAGGYFGIENARNNATKDELVQLLLNSTNSQARVTRLKIQEVADYFGLRHAMYEGGPDTAQPLQWGRDSGLLKTVLDLHYDERMGDLIIHDLWHNWFTHPDIDGDVFIYFTVQSLYSRWGMWGLTEDITNIQTPKFKAIYNLVGMQQSVPPAPLGVKVKVNEDNTVSFMWHSTFGADSYSVKRGQMENGPYSVVVENVIETGYTDEISFDHAVYYYVISATNDYGESRNSMPVKIEFSD